MLRMSIVLTFIVINIMMNDVSNVSSEKGKIKKELLDMGFLEEHIDLSLQISNNLEEAAECIVRMIENEDFYLQLKSNVKANSCLNNNNSNNNNSDLSSQSLNYKMTIGVRKDLGMSIGKTAAQVGHGVLEAYKVAVKSNPEYVRMWEEYNGSRKITLSVNSLKELRNLQEEAKALKLPCAVIADAGKTELEPGTITVIAIGPGPYELIDKVTGKLELLK